MFASKEARNLYKEKFNLEINAQSFQVDAFFNICSKSITKITKSLSKNTISFNLNELIPFYSFNEKYMLKIKSELEKYRFENNINPVNENEYEENMLSYIYAYNLNLAKFNDFQSNAALQNFFLYFYCGLFLVKLQNKKYDDFIISKLKKFKIDKQLSQLNMLLSSLTWDSNIILLASFLNWINSFINHITNQKYKYEPVENKIDLKKELSLEHTFPSLSNNKNESEIKHESNDQKQFKLTFEKLKNLKKHFNEKIIGQPTVITKINEILISEMYNLSKKNTRPIGVLFFVGPTGVGKTETVKELSRFLYGTERIHRFDMSEYKSEVAIQKLIGAPNGYVGYQEGGTLTNAMQQNPNSIVLFDEIEKADKTVFDLFLQLLDEGVVTSNKGVKSYFNNSIIVFTSNLGVSSINNNMSYDQIQEVVKNNVDNFFSFTINRPELLGRIGKDNIVVFNLINKKEDLYKILDIMFNDFLKEYIDLKIILKFDKIKVYDEILKTVDLTKGARDIRNKFELFKKHLYTAFFEKELSVDNMKNKEIRFDYENNKILISSVKTKTTNKKSSKKSKKAA